MKILFILLGMCSTAAAQNYLMHVDYCERGVMHTSMGPAVCISTHHFLTVGHAIKGGPDRVIRVNLDGNFYPATLIAVSSDKVGPDLALLHVTDGQAFRRTIELNPVRPAIGSTVEVRSSLHGPATGRVLQYFTLSNPQKTPIVDTSFNRGIEQGDSGAAVIQDGKLVGILMGYGFKDVGQFMPGDVIGDWIKTVAGQRK